MNSENFHAVNDTFTAPVDPSAHRLITESRQNCDNDRPNWRRLFLDPSFRKFAKWTNHLPIFSFDFAFCHSHTTPKPPEPTAK